MFAINEDMSIYLTRGDVALFTVSAMDENGNPYKFTAGDIVRIKVFDKKACENVRFQKDFPIETTREEVEILLEEKETKIGEVISKPRDYWYEIELNPYSDPQTIVGYDDDGPKIFRLFPEGKDIYDDMDEEELKEATSVMDSQLSLTSTRPVQNQAIARAVLKLDARVTAVEETGGSVQSGGGTGLTSVQVKALDEMFKVCARSKADTTAEYERFRIVFGLDEEEEVKPEVPTVIPAVSVALSSTSVTFNAHGSRTITATVNPTNTTDKVVWSSSDESVAVVTNGVIKSVGNGNAVITARTGNVYATCDVTVDVADLDIELSVLESISVSYTGGSVEVGTSLDELKKNLVVTAHYSDGDTSVVNDYTLSGSIGTGSNTITVAYWEKTATFTVTGKISVIPATKVTLNKTSIQFTDESNVQLTATVEPSNTTNTLEWTSSDETVAVVTNGLVKPIANGSATITAKAGGVSAKCTVTVNIVEEVTLTSITATYSGGEVAVGTSVNDLKKNIVVKAKYSDGSTSTVNDYTLSGSIGLGNNTITVSYSGKTASFTVKGISLTVPATKVTLDKTTVEIKDMSNIQLTATVEPSNTTDTVVWTSDREDVATVTNGLVKPISPGIAIIRATAGSVYAYCHVDVVIEEEEVVTLTGISANYTGGSMSVGSVVNNITGLTITAEYSDGTTATVSDYTLSGKIEKGSNVITVTYKGFTTTFTVNGSDGDYVFETVSFSFMTSGKSIMGGSTWQGQSIYYADAIEIKDGVIYLVGSTSVKLYRTNNASYNANDYEKIKGKYVCSGSINGSIYFVEESATHSIATESSTLTGSHEKVTYTPAYRVRIKED